MESIGTRVREARERRLLTQEELGERANVQPVTISRIENDKAAGRPRISTIRKLATALDVDAGWIMYGEDTEGAKNAA